MMEYFKNFLPFSSILFAISGSLLKEADRLKNENKRVVQTTSHLTFYPSLDIYSNNIVTISLTHSHFPLSGKMITSVFL